MQCPSTFAAEEASDADPAESLRARYAALTEQLEDNQFQQPLYLQSAESSGNLAGDIYARVDYPFAIVDAALNDPTHWCDVLILHVNTKYCRASQLDADTALQVNIGTKYEQPLEDTYRLDFVYHASKTTRDYFRVLLSADRGPLATHDYRILMEAVSVGTNQTFLHFTYSYAYGLAGRFGL
jgi:hypothetical protein